MHCRILFKFGVQRNAFKRKISRRVTYNNYASLYSLFCDRLNKVTTLHYKQYIFLMAPLIGADELNILTALQERYIA